MMAHKSAGDVPKSNGKCKPLVRCCFTVGRTRSMRQHGRVLSARRVSELHSLAVNLLAVHRNFFGRNDSQLDTVALDGDDLDANYIVDDDFFADPARQNKHDWPLRGER